MGCFVSVRRLFHSFPVYWTLLRPSIGLGGAKTAAAAFGGQISLTVEGNPEKMLVIAEHPFLLTDHACMAGTNNMMRNFCRETFAKTRLAALGPTLNNESN